MTLNKCDTVIIVGDSPFLDSVESKLHYVLDRYHSIGINGVVKKCNVSEHAFLDRQVIPLTNLKKDIKTVSLKYYGDLIQKEDKELYNTFSFDFQLHSSKDLYKDGKLPWCGFTHDYAISYCIYKGWKNIVLLGAADFVEGEHYSNRYLFKYSDNLKENSKKFIEEICTKRANIFTCNPNSYISLEQISIDALLK